jgi:hypothetical protein
VTKSLAQPTNGRPLRVNSLDLPTPNQPLHHQHPPTYPPVLRTASARGTYTRQPVMADDGGTLGLDWWCGADRPGYGAPDSPVCLFIRECLVCCGGGILKGVCILRVLLTQWGRRVFIE